MSIGKWLKALRKEPKTVTREYRATVYQYELISTMDSKWVKYWVKGSVWPEQADKADGEIQAKDAIEVQKILRKKYNMRKFTFISEVP